MLQSLAVANGELEEKLKSVQKDLEDSAYEMDKMTDEYTKLKTVLQQTDMIVEEMRKERDVLRAQVPLTLKNVCFRHYRSCDWVSLHL